MQHHSETTMSSMKQPLCPKPRRVCPSFPDFLKPLSCSLHSSNCQQSSEGRSGVLSVIDKPIEGGTIESMWYAGSPPRRTGNPLVHDLHFIHCLDLLPNFSRTKA
ncbi:unnamed protein product [Thlaspi arvense]|uniref:Uncharacterized protein n=1 Tax=Thlaspi arvense TaxID=13288 RepID=A0AAU9SEE2_THLAR|nr:unnamed protein product [Thlaspi arvense]